MSEMEMAALGIGAIFLYICAVVLAICLALAPLFCWIHLRNIRRRQAENAHRMDEHLCAMRRSLERIDDAMRHICGMLEKK